jgi:hypothetical protein
MVDGSWFLPPGHDLVMPRPCLGQAMALPQPMGLNLSVPGFPDPLAMAKPWPGRGQNLRGPEPFPEPLTSD